MRFHGIRTAELPMINPTLSAIETVADRLFLERPLVGNLLEAKLARMFEAGMGEVGMRGATGTEAHSMRPGAMIRAAGDMRPDAVISAGAAIPCGRSAVIPAAATGMAATAVISAAATGMRSATGMTATTAAAAMTSAAATTASSTAASSTVASTTAATCRNGQGDGGSS
jgi:hypothetical protein